MLVWPVRKISPVSWLSHLSAYALVLLSYVLLIWAGLSVSHEHWPTYLASRYPDLVPGPCRSTRATPLSLLTDASIFPNCKMNDTQFVKMIRSMAGHGLTEEVDIRFLFNMVDSDANGVLQWPEIKGILTPNRFMTILDWWRQNEERRKAGVPITHSFKPNYFAV
jgi:hypothetical protein